MSDEVTELIGRWEDATKRIVELMVQGGYPVGVQDGDGEGDILAALEHEVRNLITDKKANDFLADQARKWDREVRALLTTTIPAELVVFVREGGGPEDLSASLAVTGAKLVQALRDAQAEAAKARERADRAERDHRTVRESLSSTQIKLAELERTHGMYRRAWFRELGTWVVGKAHEIDGLVLGTQKLRKAAEQDDGGLRAELEKQTAIAVRVPGLEADLQAAQARMNFAAERVAVALDQMVVMNRLTTLVPVEVLRGLIREAIQADPPPDGAELLDKYRGEAERERFAAMALLRRREQLQMIANALDEFGPQHLRDGRSLTVADCVMDAMATLRRSLAQARAEPGEAPALRAEVERLKKLIDRDRTGLASGLDEVKRIVSGYSWIGDGTWGSYSYEDHTVETLRREICSAFGAISQQVGYSLRQSGWRADAAFRPEVEAKVDDPPPRVVPLWCPFCGAPHHDTGKWAARPHRTHRCAGCGAEWHIEPVVFGAPPASVKGLLELPAHWRAVVENTEAQMIRHEATVDRLQVRAEAAEAARANVLLRAMGVVQERSPKAAIGPDDHAVRGYDQACKDIFADLHRLEAEQERAATAVPAGGAA